MTRGDLDTFFMSAKNSVLMLQIRQTGGQPGPGSGSQDCPRRAEALPLEPLGLPGPQVRDVRAACEDAFQVDPAPLHVDPHVEEGHDAVQLVLPAQGILLKHLEGQQKEEVKTKVSVPTQRRPGPLSMQGELVSRSLAHVLESRTLGAVGRRHDSDGAGQVLSGEGASLTTVPCSTETASWQRRC